MARHNMVARLGTRSRHHHGIFHIMGHGQHAAFPSQKAQYRDDLGLFWQLVWGLAV